MSRTRFTAKDIARELNALAAQDPEHVDHRVKELPPKYVEHGQPNCLVAAIMHRLGVSVGVLKLLDIEGGRFGGGVIIRVTQHPIRRRFTPAAWEMLCFLQKRNDWGVTWGKAEEAVLCAEDPYGFSRPRDLRPERPWLYELEED